jgi:hypothetical protein
MHQGRIECRRRLYANEAIPTLCALVTRFLTPTHQLSPSAWSPGRDIGEGTALTFANLNQHL